MPRFKQLWKNSTGLFKLGRLRFSLDIGSFYTRVVVNDILVFDQPTCFLTTTNEKAVLTLGDQALALWGKEPPQTQLVFPVQQGVVFDQDFFKLFLEAVLNQIKQEINWPLLSQVNVQMALPSNATNLDKKIIKTCLADVGFSKIELIPWLTAIAASLKTCHDSAVDATSTRSAASRTNPKNKNSKLQTLPRPSRQNINFNPDLLILDIGDQTTEFGIISQGQATTAYTLNFGGRQLTQAIQNFFKQKHNLLISIHHAAKLKHRLPNILSDQTEAKISIRGVSLHDDLVKTKTIEIQELGQVFKKELNLLNNQLKRTFTQVKSGPLLSAMDSGLYLTGGGSLLAGLDEYLTEHFQTPVELSTQPFIDVVKGVNATYDA
jgi:rod shape-determining protein MreB